MLVMPSSYSPLCNSPLPWIAYRVIIFRVEGGFSAYSVTFAQYTFHFVHTWLVNSGDLTSLVFHPLTRADILDRTEADASRNT